MNHKIIHTKNAPEPIGPYSQAVVSGNMIYTSGQIAIDPGSGELIAGGIEEQANRVLENLKAVLIAAGGSLTSVVKTTIYLKNIGDFLRVNDIYAGYFGNSMPARSTVEVSCLPKNALIEIDCVASIEQG